MSQMEKQDKTAGKYLTGMKISNLSDRIRSNDNKMLSEPGRTKERHSEKFHKETENIRKLQTEHKAEEYSSCTEKHTSGNQ